MPVNFHSWSGNIGHWVDSKQKERAQLPAGWEAPSLKDIEMKQISRKFFKEIKFINVGGKDKPCMTPRPPATTYRLPSHGKCTPVLEEFYKAFKIKMEQYEYAENWYILDPYHQWFVLTPSKMKFGEEWVIIPYPDGEYQAFISKNLKNGLFVHPWARTLCLFGGHMQFDEGNLPRLLEISTIIVRM